MQLYTALEFATAAEKKILYTALDQSTALYKMFSNDFTTYPGCRVKIIYCTILIQTRGYKGSIDRKKAIQIKYRFNQNKPSVV